jgi:hypothetical protein
VPLDVLEEVLRRAGAYPDDMERTLALADRAIHDDPVRRIFIHLDAMSPPARFGRYGRRLVPVFNYFQVALVLFSDGILGSGAVIRVAREMVEKYGYQLGALANSLQDLVRRGSLRRVALPALAEAVLAAGDLTMPFGPAHKIIASFSERLRGLRSGPEVEPRAEEPIDYLAAIEEDLSAHRARTNRGGGD